MKTKSGGNERNIEKIRDNEKKSQTLDFQERPVVPHFVSYLEVSVILFSAFFARHISPKTQDIKQIFMISLTFPFCFVL